MPNLSPESREVRFNPSKQFGFEYSLKHYLPWNPQDTRSAYIVSAQKQAELLLLPLDSIVVEVACGTGNSGLAFQTSAVASIKQLIAFDRSNNSTIAGRRFNQVNNQSWSRLLSDISDIPHGVLDNIERSRRDLNTQAFVIRSQAQGIPLPSGFADGMFCVQGFHWLLFADEDILGKNPDKVLTSLKEMRRVLKPGAELTFDTHGGAVDFQNNQMNGVLLNELYFGSHPIHIAFVEAFNIELQNAGFNVQIDPQRPNKYFGVLNEDFVSNILQKAGFEPIPLRKNALYDILLLPIDIEQFIEDRRHGGQMVYFTDPEISNLSEDQKAKLLNSAADKVIQRRDFKFLSERPAYEFLVFFKARAI